MTRNLDKLVRKVIESVIKQEIFPEKMKRMTKDDISDLINYVAEDFYEFIKDEMQHYFIDKKEEDENED